MVTQTSTRCLNNHNAAWAIHGFTVAGGDGPVGVELLQAKQSLSFSGIPGIIFERQIWIYDCDSTRMETEKCQSFLK